MVPGATHVPMADLLDDPSRLPRPDAAETTDGVGVAIYCRAGIRSARGAAQLRADGIAVTSINGGYLAYLSQAADRTVWDDRSRRRTAGARRRSHRRCAPRAARPRPPCGRGAPPRG